MVPYLTYPYQRALRGGNDSQEEQDTCSHLSFFPPLSKFQFHRETNGNSSRYRYHTISSKACTSANGQSIIISSGIEDSKETTPMKKDTLLSCLPPLRPQSQIQGGKEIESISVSNFIYSPAETLATLDDRPSLRIPLPLQSKNFSSDVTIYSGSINSNIILSHDEARCLENSVSITALPSPEEGCHSLQKTFSRATTIAVSEEEGASFSSTWSPPPYPGPSSHYSLDVTSKYDYWSRLTPIRHAPCTIKPRIKPIIRESKGLNIDSSSHSIRRNTYQNEMGYEDVYCVKKREESERNILDETYKRRQEKNATDTTISGNNDGFNVEDSKNGIKFVNMEGESDEEECFSSPNGMLKGLILMGHSVTHVTGEKLSNRESKDSSKCGKGDGNINEETKKSSNRCPRARKTSRRKNRRWGHRRVLRRR